MNPTVELVSSLAWPVVVAMLTLISVFLVPVLADAIRRRWHPPKPYKSPFNIKPQPPTMRTCRACGQSVREHRMLFMGRNPPELCIDCACSGLEWAAKQARKEATE